jgi:hypothetical protein
MAVKKKRRKQEQKDRWWIWDVIEFFIDILEILLFIPRFVFRVVREW